MMEQDQAPAGMEAPVESPPWSAREAWVSVLLLVLLNIGLLLFVRQSSGAQLAESALVIAAELAYLLPVVIVLVWKRIPWRHIGFGGFEWSTLGIGCGTMLGAYVVILVHNVIITLLGIAPQGQAILDVLNALDSPVWLIVAAVIVAPLVEEIFFRGFLFQGFRQKYGWVNAMLLSSAIFAAAHLDPVSLVPTFLLGLVFSYTYQRSNSVWPGVILHFLVNGTSTLMLYLITKLPGLIPS